MKCRMCKIRLKAKCYFIPKAFQMVSAVKEDTVWKSWEGRVKNGPVGVTIVAWISQQQNSCALTTAFKHKDRSLEKLVVVHPLSKNPIKQLLSEVPQLPSLTLRSFCPQPSSSSPILFIFLVVLVTDLRLGLLNKLQDYTDKIEKKKKA